MSEENCGDYYNLGRDDADSEWREKTAPLVTKAKNLVALLDDAERNQGGLVSVDILKSANELRLELAKWVK